jgi:Ca-activated chloride channel family protein
MTMRQASKFLMLLAAVVLTPAGPARAGAIFFPGHLDGQTFVPDPKAKGPCFAVRYSTITAEVAGATAATKIEETIAGPVESATRTVCLIPLPTSVVGMTATVALTEGEAAPRHVEAKFLPADEARAIYEAVAKGTKAVAVLSLAGKPALLIDRFALPPKSVMTVSFTQRIARRAGVSFYDCPMPAAAWAREPVARVSVSVTVTDERPLRAMFSPSHHAVVERAGLRKAGARVTADNWAGRDDFTLCYVADRDDLGLRLLPHRPSKTEDGYFLLLGNPTGSADRRDVPAKDVLFCLDTSGSMRGEKVEQARAAVEYCLDHLNAGDRFNIITFGTEVKGFRNAVAAGDKATVAAAKEFIDEAVARGRTNISGALAKGLAGRPTDGRLRIMIFLTDGTPTAGELVAEKIIEKLPEMNGSRTRIFVMGVGHDVNAHLLDKLAAATDGSTEYVDPDQEIDVKIAALYDRLSNPVLADVKVAFGELRPTAVFPQKLPALFAGSEVMVAGRYRKAGTFEVKLTGTLAGKDVAYLCRAELPEATAGDENEFVAPLWAARKIGFLLREIRLNGQNKELIEEVVRLSTKFGIVTEYTNFLATAGGFGGDLMTAAGRPMAKAAYEQVADNLVRARAQQAGQWAVNQSVNEIELQNRMVVSAEANVFRDRQGRMVANDNISQVGRRVFYLRDGQWVDADEAGQRTARRVKLFSPEYFKLLRSNKDFARAQRLGWNVEMNVAGERVVVEKDGKIRDEALRARNVQQAPARRLNQLRQQDQRSQQQLNQIMDPQIQRPVPKTQPAPAEQRKANGK